MWIFYSFIPVAYYWLVSSGPVRLQCTGPLLHMRPQPRRTAGDGLGVSNPTCRHIGPGISGPPCGTCLWIDWSSVATAPFSRWGHFASSRSLLSPVPRGPPAIPVPSTPHLGADRPSQQTHSQPGDRNFWQHNLARCLQWINMYYYLSIGIYYRIPLVIIRAI